MGQDKELGKVMQLQADDRRNIFNFLVNADIVWRDVRVHGHCRRLLILLYAQYSAVCLWLLLVYVGEHAWIFVK